MAIATPAPTNEDIRRRAVNELKWDAEVEASEIGVAVDEGLVTLTGRVDRVGRKWAAEHAVLRVRAIRNLVGARGITNLITVRPPSTPMPDELNDRIAAALIRNALIDARRVTVTACGTHVVLTGTVRSWAERQETERVTSSAPGVSEVENRITVRP